MTVPTAGTASQLWAIAYVSASVMPMTPEALEGLLVEARALNQESGVTGVLLYADGQFMQYFEGSPADMRVTYDRIQRSRRHTRITEMLNDPIAEREFPDWTMGVARPVASELLALSTADWVMHKSRSTARDGRSIGIAMLQHFWARQRQGG